MTSIIFYYRVKIKKIRHSNFIHSMLLLLIISCAFSLFCWFFFIFFCFVMYRRFKAGNDNVLWFLYCYTVATCREGLMVPQKIKIKNLVVTTNRRNLFIVPFNFSHDPKLFHIHTIIHTGILTYVYVTISKWWSNQGEMSSL